MRLMLSEPHWAMACSNAARSALRKCSGPSLTDAEISWCNSVSTECRSTSSSTRSTTKSLNDDGLCAAI